MKKTLLTLFAVIASLSAALSQQTISLNRDWNFTPEWEVKLNTYTTITLPHTWNSDALSGDLNYTRGIGNYEKVLDVPAEWEGKEVFLRFRGVNSVANVFVNGNHQQEHRGGYTTFNVNITDELKFGEPNTILVRASNAQTLDVMPLVGDFNIYGGIYRNVDLIIKDPTHISLDDYGSAGVYLTQHTTKELAKLEARVLVNSASDKSPKLTLKLLDARSQVVATQSAEVEIVDGCGEAKVNFEIKNPKLWNGRKSPYLYSVVTTLESEGRVVDTQSDNIGFRFFSVDPDKGFFLNGEHLQLKGVCRHQDRTEIGNAITELHHIEDMDIMLEMGVNAMRLAHYPQDKYFYDLCDKYGIVVWAEIPFIGPGGYRASGFVDQEPFRENGIQQLRELIRQNYNHPSICFWGLFNELKLDTDNPCEYLNELNEIAHAEDATRLTTSASHLDKNDDPEVREINSITDLIAWNKYYGWYGYDASRIIEWLDKTRADYPGRSICLSEYGAGASIIHQSEELIKADPTSRWHPENWQTHFHEQYWAAIDTRPYLWATFVWNMFDFGAAHRTEGEINGKNDKGLVTFDRHVKKDAFYFYKANWNEDDKFVYIAERRLLRRSTKPQTFKVFSNESDIELIVNGVSLGKRKGTYGTFVWEGVELQSGENTITAKSRKLSDEIVIFRD